MEVALGVRSEKRKIEEKLKNVARNANNKRRCFKRKEKKMEKEINEKNETIKNLKKINSTQEIELKKLKSQVVLLKKQKKNLMDRVFRLKQKTNKQKQLKKENEMLRQNNAFNGESTLHHGGDC